MERSATKLAPWLLLSVVFCGALLMVACDGIPNARLAMDEIMRDCEVDAVEMYGDPLKGPIILAVRLGREQVSASKSHVVSCVLVRWQKRFDKTPDIYLFEAGANMGKYILQKDLIGDLSSQNYPVFVYRAPPDG